MLQPRSCTGRKRAVPALSESPTSKARWAPGVAPAPWASARKTSNALTARSGIGVGLFPGCRAPTRLRAPLDPPLAPLGGRGARREGWLEPGQPGVGRCARWSTALVVPPRSARLRESDAAQAPHLGLQGHHPAAELAQLAEDGVLPALHVRRLGGGHRLGARRRFAHPVDRRSGLPVDLCPPLVERGHIRG